MFNSQKKVVIFGGMFDPPHISHAILIDAVLRSFPCDEVWVMPSGGRKDKSPKTKDKDRFKMIEIFCEDYFQDSKIPVLPKNDELDLPAPTYTRALYNKLLGKYPDREFHFLMGSYNLPAIRQWWENGEEVFNNLNFVIFKEDGAPDFKLPPKNFVLPNIEVKTTVSSTYIRGRIKNGLSPLPYVLPRIANYIKERKLYRV